MVRTTQIMKSTDSASWCRANQKRRNKYTITRSKIARPRTATGPGPAWKWLYDVTLDGQLVVKGIDLLGAAKSIIRRHAKTAGGAYYVEKEWATSHSTESEGAE